MEELGAVMIGIACGGLGDFLLGRKRAKAAIEAAAKEAAKVARKAAEERVQAQLQRALDHMLAESTSWFNANLAKLKAGPGGAFLDQTQRAHEAALVEGKRAALKAALAELPPPIPPEAVP